MSCGKCSCTEAKIGEKCGHCQGWGYVPEMFSSGNNYYVTFLSCGLCRETGWKNYKGKLRLPRPGDKFVEDEGQVPSVEEALKAEHR